MHITILGASGATGRQLTEQSLARGHNVVAIARDPGRIAAPGSARLTKAAADVFDPVSVGRVIEPGTVLISGLGVANGHTGTLLAGARAVVDAGPARIIWLGAFGTGVSGGVAGPVTRWVLRRVMGDEIDDKVAADSAIIGDGGTVFHAGPLTNKPPASTPSVVDLGGVPRRLFPATISRATVASVMLSEAENPMFAGLTVVPLGR